MPAGPFIVARLSADAGIAGTVKGQIYASVAPQGTKPPFLCWEEFAPQFYSAMGVDTDIADAHVRIHVWAVDPADATILAGLVRKSLQRYRGNAYASTQVDDIFVEPGGPQMFDPIVKSWHLVRDFRVIYREP